MLRFFFTFKFKKEKTRNHLLYLLGSVAECYHANNICHAFYFKIIAPIRTICSILSFSVICRLICSTLRWNIYFISRTHSIGRENYMEKKNDTLVVSYVSIPLWTQNNVIHTLPIGRHILTIVLWHFYIHIYVFVYIPLVLVEIMMALRIQWTRGRAGGEARIEFKNDYSDESH